MKAALLIITLGFITGTTATWCLLDITCPPKLACIKGQCADPCVGRCGTSATCAVSNHNYKCSCPPGTTGDPLVKCKTGCTIDTDCSSQLVCATGQCVDPCVTLCCGANATCTVSNHLPKCTWPRGNIGKALIEIKATTECMIDADCSPQLVCAAGKCEDPCVGFCAPNAICTVNNHAPTCSCPAGTIGNPLIGCNAAKCMLDSDCSPQLVCASGKCEDPCVGFCPSNSICTVTNHAPTCSCPPGTIGNPLIGCNAAECTFDVDCSPQLVCAAGKCEDPCVGFCASNAICTVNNHAPTCSCPAGTIGNPLIACNAAQCTIDADCSPQLVCAYGKCEDPCVGFCPFNSICTVTNHAPRCSCPAGTIGNPLIGCNAAECTLDADCSHQLVCAAGKCEDPCVGFCASSATCAVTNHAPACSCPAGTIGNPLIGCIAAVCTLDVDCSPLLVCAAGKCEDPCVGFCASSAICTVTNHAPACSCPAGTIGNPLIGCNAAECTPDADCSPQLVCAAGKCENPCVGFCASSAICTVINHAPACSCPAGTIGNPLIGCNAAECTLDADCSPQLVCAAGKCEDPCVGFCGSSAICSVTNHAPACSCPAGTIGNPLIGCNAAECTLDDDCSPQLVCAAGKCEDPCVGFCAPSATCTVTKHAPTCSCPAGTIGNPLIGCNAVECTLDADCSPQLVCAAGKCEDPCVGFCASSAICTITNHAPTCSCPAGTIGNPRIGCNAAECTLDVDCSPQLVCAAGKCEDPCVGFCATSAICTVTNYAPTCSCPAGTIGNPIIGCTAAECTLDIDCSPQLVCAGGKCEDPCVGFCASDAICTVTNHAPTCSCPAGTIGNPLIGCNAAECTLDADCSPQLVCTAGKCKDPCVGFCASSAICTVTNYSPKCSCKAGTIGNPLIGCTAAECTLDTDCSPQLVCAGGKCEDPCVGFCASNAICTVTNHAPTCSCPAGTIGNPLIGCNAAECTLDADCSPQLVCTAGKCEDPCVGFCASGAICTVTNYSPKCSCPAGTIGNPLIGCNAAECTLDADCSPTLICAAGKCEDPCVGFCASSAICTVTNHAPTCSCPAGTIGNPLIGCTAAVTNPSTECKLLGFPIRFTICSKACKVGSFNVGVCSYGLQCCLLG